MSNKAFFVPKAISSLNNKLVERNIMAVRYLNRNDLIENYDQYKQLSKYKFLQKIKLSKLIINNLAFWIDDIKTIHSKETTLVILKKYVK